MNSQKPDPTKETWHRKQFLTRGFLLLHYPSRCRACNARDRAAIYGQKQGWLLRKISIVVARENSGRTFGGQISILAILFVGGLLLAVAGATVWLGAAGVGSVPAELLTAWDQENLEDQTASLSASVTELAGTSEELEGLLRSISTLLSRGSTAGADQAVQPFQDLIAPGTASDTATQLRELAALLQAGSEVLTWTRDVTGLVRDRVLVDIPNVWPLANRAGRVAFEFGPAIHPILKTWYLHKGFDISAPPGTPIIAMADGMVGDIRRDADNYGLQIVLEHKYGFKTRYTHLLRTDVTVGETVRAGQRIAALGSTGLTTGPTLHLEIMLGNDVLDPVPFLQMSNSFARPASQASR